MNLQNIVADFSQNNSQTNSNQTNSNQTNSGNQAPSPLGALASMVPGGLTGGAAAGGLMALFMGSKSTRKMAKKVAKYGGTAVLGGLAYHAYGNWQKNKASGQTQAINDYDIEQSNHTTLSTDQQHTVMAISEPLHFVLIKAMIAASKSDGEFDTHEQKKLFDAVNQLNVSNEEKALVFDLMNREITIQEIADQVSRDEHKAEVYLAAYLAIAVDHQLERTFLNNLAMALDLPKGLTAYLEQQADLGAT